MRQVEQTARSMVEWMGLVRRVWIERKGRHWRVLYIPFENSGTGRVDRRRR